MKLFKFIVNEEQLRVIQEALESYTRLGIGQLETILFNLGFSKSEQFKDNIQEIHSSEIEEAIKTIKYKLFDLSFKASYSISNDKVNEDFKVCYDIYTTINNVVSELGMNGKLTVQSDNPRRVSKNGLIQIELCTKEEEEKYARNKKSKEN